MAVKLKIKKGDNVEVIYGADKGRKGAVIEVDRDKLKVKVQGIRMQTHFDKKEGIQKKEGFIDYSNVKLASTSGRGGAKKKAKKKTKASPSAKTS